MKSNELRLKEYAKISEFLGYSVIGEKYGDLVISKGNLEEFSKYYEQPDEVYQLWFDLSDKYKQRFVFSTIGNMVQIRDEKTVFQAVLRYGTVSSNMHECILSFIDFMNEQDKK